MRQNYIRKMGLLILCFVLTACTKQAESKQQIAFADDNDSIVIGLTFDTYVLERWERDRDAFVARAEELGAKVNVQNANGDIEKQKQQIAYFIEQKVDVIVVIAVDSDGLKKEVKEVKKAGIPIIAYDRMLNDADADLYISFDNETVGKMMADAVKEALPKGGKVILAQGPTTDHNVEMVYQGIMTSFKESSIEISDTMNAKKWKAEEVFDFMDAYLDGNQDVDAVICGNDSLAGQAVNALAVKRLAGKVVVTGQDADLEACQRIMEGTQNMTVYKPIEKLASKGAECAVALAKGVKIQRKETISDGTYTIPYITIQPTAVTASNMDDVIIKSGFHMWDEVHRNMED